MLSRIQSALYAFAAQQGGQSIAQFVLVVAPLAATIALIVATVILSGS